MKHSSIITALSLAIVPTALAAGDCLCGYTVNQTGALYYGLFTDILEADFLHAPNVSLTGIGSTEWLPQEYNTTAALAAHGEYGTSKQLGNLIANPLPDNKWGGTPATIGDAGLQLWVRHETEDGLIPVAEASSHRDDMIYGSYRAAIKFSGMNGTSGAFFWHHNVSMHPHHRESRS